MQKVPFNAEKEMQYTETFNGIGTNPDGSKFISKIPALNTPISNKENMLLLVKEGAPLWMPLFTDRQGFGPVDFPDNVARGFVEDLVPFNKDKDSGGKDFFEVEWDYIPLVGGSMVKPGNPKVKDLENWEEYIKMPDLDAIDWEAIAKRNEGLFDGKRLVNVTIFTGYFERLISLVDFEDAALALIDEEEQDSVHRLFEALTNTYIDFIKRCKKYFNIDMVTLHDDWGSQRAPFFSLDVCMEMLVPYIKRVVDACHELGLIYQAHSCGKNEMLLDAYIAAGVDIWFPQPMNDTLKLLKESDGKIALGANFAIDDNMTEADIDKAAEEFVAKYDGYKKVIANARGKADLAQRFNERVYALSRESYNR